MSEVGEIYAAMSKAKKERRHSNTLSSTKLLESSGVDFESKNGGARLIVTAGKKKIDFWPSTGLFKIRGSNIKYRGIKNLLKQIKDLT